MQSLTLFQQLLAVVSGLLVGFTLGLIGTTALAVALTAYINLLPHWRAGNVRWPSAIAFAIPGVLGAAVGAQIGKIVPGKQLLFLFALLMIGVAITMLRPAKSSTPKPVHTGKTMIARTTPVGFLVGILSGFFGIGGGFLIVPGLMFATGMPLLNAIGTSLFSVGMFGTTTAITYALSGLVNWLVALEYIAGGVLGGLAGARLATRLGKQKKALSRVFAGVIIVVAIYMFYVNLTAMHL